VIYFKGASIDFEEIPLNAAWISGADEELGHDLHARGLRLYSMSLWLIEITTTALAAAADGSGHHEL